MPRSVPVRHGAKVHAGGERLARKGYFFAPTILTDVSDEVAICAGSAHAIVVEDSASTSFIGVNLRASPGMGILENAASRAIACLPLGPSN